MPGTPSHDVLIAGAGPAGVHTALRLAREGWRVALLDSRTFPRAKPCGEFLSPACLPLLDELDLLAELERSRGARVVGMNLFAARAHAHGGYARLGPFAASHGHGLGIRRELLDHQAVLAAERSPNITVLQGWRVSEPIRDARGRTIGLVATDPDGTRARLAGRFTVGADGLRSRIASALGWSEPWRGVQRFALVARYRCNGGLPPGQEAEVHFVGNDYFVLCPVDGDLVTANLVVDGHSIPKGRAALAAVFRERLERAPALARRLAGAERVEPPCACGPLRAEVRQRVGPGVALVGDACGFVDPLTGEGLYFAMQGAKWLSEAISEALRDPARERAALRRYERSRRRELAPRHALARLLQRALRIPKMPERAVDALGRHPGLCDLVLGLTGDYVPPSGLLSPRVWRSAWGGRATGSAHAASG